MNARCFLLLSFLCFPACVVETFAQSSVLNYHGQLNDGAGPANGNYDLRFELFGVSGGPVTGPVTNAATVVSNGLFTVLLDFDSQPFDGSDRWLEIAVRTNGNETFVPLSPRQKINSLPYAIMAANLSGSVSDAQLSPNIAQLNANQIFSGTVRFSSQANSFSGSFTGDAAGLTNSPYADPPFPWLKRPAMGIANWLDYFDSVPGQEPGEDVATNAILKMATSGLVASGRDWLRIDYGWIGGRVNGSLIANPNKFPHGMPWLIQFAHSQNVKVDLAVARELESSLEQLPGDIRTLF